MAPSCSASDMLPPLDLSCYSPPASNWERGTLKEICEGTPPCGSNLCRPRCPSPCISSDCCSPPACPPPCMEPVRGCRLPPIEGRICGNHPRDDCCMVPKCYTGVPVCPVGICVERRRPMKPYNKYEPPAQPFEGCSLYKTQFRGCMGLPARSFKPSSNFDPSAARISDLTHYREQFTCKPICLTRERAKNDYLPPCAPFDGCSTYKVDYRGCCGNPARSLRPNNNWDPSSGRMDGTTTYRTNYIPYCEAEAEYARGKSIRPSQESSFSCSPFDGCSTYRMEFVPKCCTRAGSKKPSGRTSFSDARFADRTTYRTDYLPFYFKDHCPDPCLPRECCMPRCCQ